ncbi:MAG: hypothetical protein IPP91_11165 [Betaproteobacteria bacterium]|nr:hypothetical protein [Betaproteobacteria bacterium]
MKKSEALAHFDGSVAKLAEALGISRPAVYLWPDEQIPELRAFQIAKIVAERGAIPESDDCKVRAA